MKKKVSGLEFTYDKNDQHKNYIPGSAPNLKSNAAFQSRIWNLVPFFPYSSFHYFNNLWIRISKSVFKNFSILNIFYKIIICLLLAFSTAFHFFHFSFFLFYFLYIIVVHFLINKLLKFHKRRVALMWLLR